MTTQGEGRSEDLYNEIKIQHRNLKPALKLKLLLQNQILDPQASK
jgi:hypothetical protein